MQMTQQELGTALGYSTAMVARLESGERLPDLALVKTTYVEALGLQHEPELAARLIELAAAARGEAQPAPELAPPPTSQPQRPNNLPRQLTRFIGREREIAEVTRLLSMTSLLTLTGSGGCGKTRLALEVGATLVRTTHHPDVQLNNGIAGGASPLHTPPAFPDGVWLAGLAPLADPGLVADTVLAALGIPASTSTATERLINDLRSRDMLLILDNCEHLIGACAELAEALLRECPHLCVLATSREALGIPGEMAWRVPPLATGEAVQLFEDRARVASPGFVMTEQNAKTIADICERLDGMPLALELAAARLRVLSVEEVASRLDDRFRLLTGGARTALRRQQTLRATIDWSFHLLFEPERGLLQRLSVFAGGCTLEAAEAICGDQPLALGGTSPVAHPTIPSADVLDLLTSLVDKSLVTVVTEQRGDPTRYLMPETIREYAAEKLREAGQTDALRDRHVAYYLAFAEQADAEMSASKWRPWTTRIEADLANLRAALAWCQSNAAQPTHAEAGLRMAVALAEFWDWNTYYGEALQWLSETIAWNRAIPRAVARPSTALQARALFLVWTPITCTWFQGWERVGELEALAEACLAQCREAGDRAGAAYCLLLLSILAWYHDDHPRALPLAMESLELFEETRDLRGIWCWFFKLHKTLHIQRAHETLVSLLEMYIRRLQEWGDRWYYGYLVEYLEGEMLAQGERERAGALCEQLLAMAAEWDDPRMTWVALHDLDVVNHPRALALAEQYLVRQRQAGDVPTLAAALHRLGQILLDTGEFERAGTVLDECVALWRAHGRAWGRYDVASSLPSYSNLAWALCDRGIVARFQGDYRLAVACFDECVMLCKESGERWLRWAALFHHGYALLDSGEVDAAAADFEESLERHHEMKLDWTWFHPLLLAALARVRWLQGQMAPALRLAGAAATFEGEVRSYQANARLDYERIVAEARARLGDPDLAAAWAEGQAMTLDQAVAYALQGGGADN
jgi:predicted ATPase